MRERATVMTAAMLAVLVSACCEPGSGDLVRETRTLPAFSRLTLDVPGVVRLVQGPPTPIKIRTDDNLMDQVRTSVRGDALVIDTRSGECVDPTELDIEVSTEEIRGLTIDGSGDIVLPEPIETDVVALAIDGSGTISADLVRAEEVSLEIDGSGEIDLAVDTDRLHSSIDGSGEYFITGVATDHEIVIDGSGDVHAGPLQTEATRVEIDGSGDCVVAAEKTLEVRIDGSGDLAYCGDPSVSRSIDGSGSIGRADPARCD